MNPWLALPAEVTAPPSSPQATPTPNCLNASQLCQWVFDQTHTSWLASGSYYFLLKPASIVLIVLLAVVARFLIRRTIDKLVSSTAGGGVPTVLKPLKERLPNPMQESGLFPERRRQRAEAIGSVLNSAATAAIYSIATLLILNELGLDLAPLLASAGIAGVALGFGAQSLVKDLLAGLFMLLEDQYGVGDVIDVGEAAGTVEAVGLRITTVRDARGVLWYIRNGEIIRVGNRSQGWAVVLVDMPIGFASVDQAVAALQEAARALATDPQWRDDLLDGPEVLGVEQITMEGAVVRTTVKTASETQWRVGRELRRRLADALADAGITDRISAGRVIVRPPVGTDLAVEAQPGLDTEI